MLPDYRGYHDCPCRDCFDIAIGGRRRSLSERRTIAVYSDRPRDPDTGRFLGRDATPDDIAEEARHEPALCSLCEEAGCDHTGQSDCRRSDAYGCDEEPDGDECPHCENGTVETANGESRCRGECGAIWRA